MKKLAQTLRFKKLRIALVTLGFAFAAQSVAATSDAAPISANCTGVPYRQFDFWLGDWDTFETDIPGGPSIARARVKSIAQGCAIHELYEQSDGLIGESILSFDAVRRQWQQTWVTNRGAVMVISGNFKNGVMVLEGEVHLPDGKTVMQRITWKRQADGVRESAVLSKDRGKTWTPAFDVLFLKRKD